MKHLLIIALMMLGHYSKANGIINYQLQNINADDDWKALEELQLPKNKSGKQKLYLDESLGLKYRDKGLEFWYKYPEDSRRYDWLLRTLTFPSDSGGPKYWKNIEAGAELSEKKPWYLGEAISVNREAIEKWESLYPKLLKEFMTADISEKKKKWILSLNLYSYLYSKLNPYYRSVSELNLKYVQQEFKQVAEMFYGDGFEMQDGRPSNINFQDKYNSEPLGIVNRIFSSHEIYGLNTNKILKFLKPFLQSSNPYIQKWANEKNKLLHLKKDFFDFNVVAMDGKPYDLSNEHGKVILLDFWSTSCGACIKAMPRLKEVHEKYKNDGFEVFSICINPDDDKEIVQQIHKKIGAKWPTFLIGGKAWDDKKSLFYKIWNTYGFDSVPQLFLLDKKGKLAAYNGTLHSDLEKIVKKLLK